MRKIKIDLYGKKLLGAIMTIYVYFKGQISDANNFADFSITRKGQDVRYSTNDSKIKALGWKPICNFDTELIDIVEHYRNKFIW